MLLSDLANEANDMNTYSEPINIYCFLIVEGLQYICCSVKFTSAPGMVVMAHSDHCFKVVENV